MALERFIGKRVELAVRNSTAALSGPLAHKVEPYLTMVGEVQKLPWWEKDTDYVPLYVKGDGNLPLRMIHVSLIKSVNGRELLKPLVERRWVVKSSSSNKEYVIVERNGKWSCECVANSTFHKTCKHIKGKLHET